MKIGPLQITIGSITSIRCISWLTAHNKLGTIPRIKEVDAQEIKVTQAKQQTILFNIF